MILVFISLTFLCFNILFASADATSDSKINFTIGNFVDYCQNGIIYWDDLGVPHSTTDPGLWCSMGADPYVPGEPEGPCCSSGMDCLNIGDGSYQCGLGDECRSDMSKAECESGGVDGYYYNFYCWCNRDDFLCDDYINSGDCDDDILHASSGDCEYKEFECEGNTIATLDCACMWVDINGVESCQLGTNYEGNHYGYGVIPNAFECFRDSEVGECVDGRQEVNWTVSVNKISGFDTGVPERCLEAADCVAGAENRYCGEPLVKLSGFSLFSLFATLFIIGIYYFSLGRFKKIKDL